MVLTHLRPRHALGPRENGWLASLLSVQRGSSQRSGLNLKGSWKLRSSWVTLQALV